MPYECKAIQTQCEALQLNCGTMQKDCDPSRSQCQTIQNDRSERVWCVTALPNTPYLIKFTILSFGGYRTNERKRKKIRSP